MAEENDIKPQPQGTIKLYDGRGYAKFPSSILQDLGIGEKANEEIPYVSHPNCILLINPNANLRDIIEGLDVLKSVLKLRCK